MNNLEKLEKLLADSTPGPWEADDEAIYIFAPDTNPVAEMRGYGAGEPQKANQELICTLRNSAPLLLEIVRKAEYFKESEQLRDAYKKFEESEL